jgi:hypothetical protein
MQHEIKARLLKDLRVLRTSLLSIHGNDKAQFDPQYQAANVLIVSLRDELKKSLADCATGMYEDKELYRFVSAKLKEWGLNASELNINMKATGKPDFVWTVQNMWLVK